MMKATAVHDEPLALLAGRDHDTRDLYARYLRHHRYRIEETGDARDALAKAIANPPSVIVTEAELAGFDGYDLCAILRQDQDTKSTPIVVLTGDEHSVQRAQAAGADVVLMKPCAPAELLQTVEHLRERSRELCALSAAARASSTERLHRASQVLEKSVRLNTVRRKDLAALANPPDVLCPRCGRPLVFSRSFTGGRTSAEREQWDYYDCAGSCGSYQYRRRTGRLKRI